MSGGFLQLAYIAEVAIVFNLAYSELRDRRYVECAENTINVLRSKLGTAYISIDHSSLYAHLHGLTSTDKKQRRSAWACCDKDGFRFVVWSWFLSEWIYPFFTTRRDKSYAINCIGVTAVLIVISTILDHYLPELVEALWWQMFVMVFICLLWPVVTIFCGRRMMSRLNRVATHLHEEFTKIVAPTVKEQIALDLKMIANTVYSQQHH